MSKLTHQQATAEIIALINTSPRSPRPDEIDAIIAKVAPPRAVGLPLGEVSPAVAAAFAEWETARANDHEAVGTYAHTDAKADDIRAEHASEVHTTKSEALLALGAKSFADLCLLLPVVAEWNSPFSAKSPDYPHCILEKGSQDEDKGMEERSVAFFIRAVMDLLRMHGVLFEPGCRPKLVRDI
jgi:hypothetical protein